MVKVDKTLHDGHSPISLRVAEHGRCPACLGDGLNAVIQFKDVPANSCIMLESRAEAMAFPRGDIELVACQTCGFVFNRAYDPALTEYSERYEPTQAYSPTFQRFHEALGRRLVDQLGLHGKTIIEVGCGQGEFLHLLCRLGPNQGIGFDPAVDARRADVVSDRAEGVELIADFFSAQSVTGLAADLLCSKMTLEHVPAVARFAALAAELARQSPPGMGLFIQIPDAERVLRDCAFWDVYYEHCNYFTESSLRRLLTRHGFQIEDVTREYDGQYLAVVARFAGRPIVDDPSQRHGELDALVKDFGARCAVEIDKWNRTVTDDAHDGGKVIIWGSGSKGVGFLSALKNPDAVSHVVDINPHRHGQFMVGTGHPIVAPEDLRAIKPSLVIVMNSVYRQEIADTLRSLGLSPTLCAL